MHPTSKFSLTGEKIALRAPEPEDLEVFYEWENDPEIWLISNTKTPFSRDVLREYLSQAKRDIREMEQFRFLITLLADPAAGTPLEKPLPVGTIDLFDYDPHHSRAGIGILIKNPSHRGQGFAREALEILCRYGFEVLLLHQLYCNIESDNEVSLRLFRNAGFEIIGIKKAWNRTIHGWQDEVMLQKINPDHIDSSS